jgi:hypothetical protein
MSLRTLTVVLSCRLRISYPLQGLSFFGREPKHFGQMRKGFGQSKDVLCCRKIGQYTFKFVGQVAVGLMIFSQTVNFEPVLGLSAVEKTHPPARKSVRRKRAMYCPGRGIQKRRHNEGEPRTS